jgi:hypothetical protein
VSSKGRRQLHRKLSSLDPDDVWALLIAAGSSPTARHRWTRVGHLMAQLASIGSRGTEPVSAEHLEELFTLCEEAEPRLSAMEDYIPEDPRDVVYARVGASLQRLGPGEVERPVADLERALMTASALDALLVPRIGFGIADVVDVLIGYQSAAIDVLSPAWSADEPDFDGLGWITDRELVAARELIALGTPDTLLNSERRLLALDWLTVDAKSLRYVIDDPSSCVGRVARLSRIDGPDSRWVPPYLIPGIIGAATNDAARLLADDPEARRRFGQTVADETRRALWAFDDVIGPPDREDGPTASPLNVVQWALSRTERRSVLVQVLSPLEPTQVGFDEMPEALRAVSELAADPDTPTTVRFASGTVTMLPGAEAVPLLVIGTPAHIAAPQFPGLPGLSLDDLRWIARSASSSSDLYSYCRDLSRLDLPEYVVFEAIDIWEWWWRNGKTFFSGGRPPSFVHFAAHSGTAEWQRAAELAHLEKALAILELPGLNRMMAVEPGASSPYAVVAFDEDRSSSQVAGMHPRPPFRGWSVQTGERPVAVSAWDPSWPTEHAEFLSNLAIGFAHLLKRVDGAWMATHEEGPVAGYVIHLAPGGAADEVLSLSSVQTGDVLDETVARVEIRLDVDALGESVDNLTTVFHGQMVRVLVEVVAATGVSEAKLEVLREAMVNSGATFAVGAERPLSSRPRLTLPVELDSALVSVVDRKVAEAVHAAGVEPGEYLGDAAKELDRTILAPAALEQLETALSKHGMDEILGVGMVQIERCLETRRFQQADLVRSITVMDEGEDTVSRVRENAARYLSLRQCCEAVMEVALRSRPSGDEPVDDVAWGELLAASRVYRDATIRSETIHHQVNPAALHVSESWELRASLIPLDEPVTWPGANGVYRLDGEAFTRALTEIDMGLSSPRPSSEESEGPDELVDRTMRETFGATGFDFVASLYALAQWPLEETDPDAITTSRERVYEFVEEMTDLLADPPGSDRVRHAVDLLISATETLRAADWRPWLTRSRRHRLVTQPLVELTDGTVIVSPRLCQTSATVYARYLQQGLLPWSQAVPAPVEKALAQVRERRNRALEREVAALLVDHGYSVISNILPTKPGRLGVPALSGEIDVVAARTGDRTIWLLEVKDPTEVFSVGDMRRSLDRFFVGERRKPAHARQLASKLADLAPHADRVASALGMPDRPRGDYVVQPIFVTRNPVPAAFVGSDLPFVVIDKLAARLDASVE